MIIKESPKLLKAMPLKFFRAKKTILISIILIIWSLMLIAIGDFFGERRSGILAKQKVKDFVSILQDLSIPTLSNKEMVSFDIDFLDLKELEDRRKLAVENYSLKFVENDYISAKMNFQGSTLPVRIRLKGSTAHEHQEVSKWSFKVQLKGDNRFMGMQSFSLMDPKRRNYMMEWIYRMALKEEGVISKDYGFINVSINGKDMGLYAFDEEFNKTMIERNQRRDAPIISLKDDSFWLEKAAFGALPIDLWGDYYLSAPMEIKNSKDNIITKHSQDAIDLLSAFRRGDLPVSKVFDIDKLAKAMALGDLFKTSHGFLPFNSVFYYNPIIHRLEPVPDDAFSELGLAPDGIYRYEDHWVKGIFLDQIISDFDFAEAYLRELKSVANKSFLDNLLLKYNREIKENNKAFSADLTTIGKNSRLPLNKLYSNIDVLSEVLNPHTAVIANFEKSDSDGVTLKIASSTALPIELISITYNNEVTLLPCSSDEKTCVNKIKGRGYNKPLNYSIYEFIYPELFDISLYPELTDSLFMPDSLKLNYRILGSDIKRSESIFSYKAYNSSRILEEPKLMNPNYNEFKFLDHNEVGKVIKIKEGIWRLEKNLIIPENYMLSAGPNTTIDFINSSVILSYSPILFEGTKESPINLISSDSSSGSLTVFANGRKSKLIHVVIDGLVNASDSSGAVTFFESPVDIQNTSFMNINSEDALNIINSTVSIENSMFSDNYSDALDIDFGTGLVSNTKFINSGNDSIDLSGSIVDISSVFISNSGDKGISIGEHSFTRIDKSEINSCRIGIAIKDDSTAIINDVKVSNCEYGVALYQKKIDFGPANAVVSLMNIEDSYDDFIIEEGSNLTVDAIKISGEFKDVYQKLYEVF